MLESLSSFVGRAMDGLRPAVDSAAFGHGALMPADHFGAGRNVSPPRSWRTVLSGTVQMVSIDEDADSPTPGPLIHAIVVDLSRNDVVLQAGALTSGDSRRQGRHRRRTSFLNAGCLSANPPSGDGPQCSASEVFALGCAIDVPRAPGRLEVVEATAKAVFAKGVPIGTGQPA